jgi:K+-sensing histidine kinase KdpD
MDAHHGRIEIQDTSAKGTTFVLEFVTDASSEDVTPIAPNDDTRL